MEEFKEVYSKQQIEKIASEFSRLKNNYYLEHVGATLYSEKQISNVYKDLQTNLFGNPHAFNTSSKNTEEIVDQIRCLIVEHFNTNLDEYDVIFTSGATNALKIVAETFDYCDNGIFTYLQDNHTSVLGMREFAKNSKVILNNEVFNLFTNNCAIPISVTTYDGNSLFVYPAQSNFSGTKYPLQWTEKVHNGILNKITNTRQTKWFCMLDVASFVSCNKLDLNAYKPDFVCLSFYKIFGYPTGLGALLVKNTSAFVLKKKYFGGGTIQMALDTEHVSRPVLHERFEDGTLPFLSIISVRHGFETLKRLSLNMDLISMHTFNIAKYLYSYLLTTHHSNGNPIAILYHDTNFEDKQFQGGVINFNLLRVDGKYIGYAEVLHVANLYKIHLRTGCFCNPGACQKHLKLSQNDVKQQFTAGHVCGDQNDLIDGKPTGSVRISFGYMSTKSDADKFLQMIEEYFVTKPIVKKISNISEPNTINLNENFSNNIERKVIVKDNNDRIDVNSVEGFLKYIFVYPIKSCGAYSVTDTWNIESFGLQWDREWMIISPSGTCLTQKQETKLCLIKPNIKLDEGVLELNYPGMQPITVPLVLTDKHVKNTETYFCQSKVCGDRVTCIDCGNEVAEWLCESLLRPGLRLLRQNSNHLRTNRKGQQSQLSLANQANYLLINTASITYLANAIPNFEFNNSDLYNLLLRFRANLIIDCDKLFAESASKEIRIGNVIFKCTGSCTRCQIICIDQLTGEKTVEPLRTLSALTESKIRFGVYMTYESSAIKQITINENVQFISSSSSSVYKM